MRQYARVGSMQIVQSPLSLARQPWGDGEPDDFLRSAL